MANVPRAILTNRASRKCSALQREQDPTLREVNDPVNTSTFVIQLVLLAAIILAPWFYKRSKS